MLTGTLPVAEAITEIRLAPGRAIELTDDRRGPGGYRPTTCRSSPRVRTTRRRRRMPGRRSSSRTTWDRRSPSASSFRTKARQTAKLAIRVPTRLSVRLEGNARARVTGVRGVHLGNVAGEVRLDGIAGAVSGTHRQGDLAVSTATLGEPHARQSSRAKLRGIQRGLTLNARSGETRDRRVGRAGRDHGDQQRDDGGGARRRRPDRRRGRRGHRPGGRARHESRHAPGRRSASHARRRRDDHRADHR